jgi:hypothetical protein
MRYKALKHQTIKLEAKAQLDFNANDGVVLVPETDSKVFIHWLNDNNKLLATYTMTFPTQIVGQVKLINALDKQTHIKVIEI